MDLHTHTDDELDVLIKLKYGDKGINYYDGTIVDHCALAREQLFRRWMRERRAFRNTDPASIEHRFKMIERYLNDIVGELRMSKTYTSSYSPQQYHGNYGTGTAMPVPYQGTYTMPPVLQNTAIPSPIII